MARSSRGSSPNLRSRREGPTMPDESGPQPGEMYLYDAMPPPLLDGTYRLDATTYVGIHGTPQELPSGSGYFDVVGPRFSLAATEVGGVFPPVNARGSF